MIEFVHVLDAWINYISLQVTSVSKKGEKFSNFLRGVLEAFSLLLEMSSFSEVGNVSLCLSIYLSFPAYFISA